MCQKFLHSNAYMISFLYWVQWQIRGLHSRGLTLLARSWLCGYFIGNAHCLINQPIYVLG